MALNVFASLQPRRYLTTVVVSVSPRILLVVNYLPVFPQSASASPVCHPIRRRHVSKDTPCRFRHYLSLRSRHQHHQYLISRTFGVSLRTLLVVSIIC